MGVSVYTPDSTKILHVAYADFVSRQIGRTVHVVQYDDGLPLLAVKLFSDGQPYTIPSNAEINIKLGKSDGKFVYNPALGCDSARHIVYFEITYQMVILAEEVSPVVEVIIGSSVSASSSISIIIDRNPVQKDSIQSTSEWKMIQQAVEYTKESINAAASASASRSAAATSASNARSSETNAARSATAAASSASAAATSASNARSSETNAARSATAAGISESNAFESEYTARVKAAEAETYGTISKSYAVGNTGYRVGENTDNAKHYAEQAGDSMHDAKSSEFHADIYSLIAQSYASGGSLAVLGDGNNEIVTHDGFSIEIFSRAGEDTDNAKYYSEQAKRYSSSVIGIEERVSENLEDSRKVLEEVCVLAEQVDTNKSSVDESEASVQRYREEALLYSKNAKDSELKAKTSEDNAKISETNAKDSEDTAKRCENICTDGAKIARSYAVGDTDYRESENVDNAKYYYQQVKQISGGLGGALMPMGTIAFSELVTQSKVSGYMFNISDEFISDESFKDGGNLRYPPGTNVYYTSDGYWDCLAGSLLSGIKGNAETEYRSGYVNITSEDIGAYDKEAVDQMVGDVNKTIAGLLETVNLLTVSLKELDDLSVYSYFVDEDGNKMLTSDRDKIILTN